MCKLVDAAGKLSAALLLALPILAAGLGAAQAGPKRDAALQDCKNIYEDQQKHCIGSSSYAACMTMVTEKYESCRAEADQIIGLQPNPTTPPKPKAGTLKLDKLPQATTQ
jgi:hypothetical protein